MICCACDSDNTVIFSKEYIPCKHCGEDTDIIYGACNNCGAIWKSVDGQVIECIAKNIPSGKLSEIIDSQPTAVQVIDLEPKKGTMSEMIHHCIRCDASAYEVGNGLYKCPECGFEWEVI